MTNTNLTAYVISVGVVNIPTGKTMYDWSIYENTGLYAFLTKSGSLLFGTQNTFNVGDSVTLRGNDSQKKLKETEVIDFAPCIKDDLLKMLKNNRYDYYPIRAFTARKDGNRKLQTSYSVKGTF